MKKYVLPIMLATGLTSTASMAASGGTITFTGSITGTTCEVVVNNGAENATITLPTVSITSLAILGQVAGRVGFTLNLTGCVISAGGANTVSGYFENGVNVVSGTGRLKNTDAAGAQNVQLQILDGTSLNPIEIGEASQIANNTFVDPASGTATLPYAVEYYATGVATAGAVASQVVYSLAYK